MLRLVRDVQLDDEEAAFAAYLTAIRLAKEARDAHIRAGLVVPERLARFLEPTRVEPSVPERGDICDVIW